MIPKIIHYCWFGGNSKPKVLEENIKKWKKILPSYEFIEWNETNFDVNLFVYTKEAYFAKKFAFVSDVARLVALLKYGGIYMDTDIILMRDFPTDILDNEGFVGFEHADKYYVATSVIGSVKENKMLEDILNLYRDNHFFNGFRFDFLTNVQRFTDYFEARGVVCNNNIQKIPHFKIYPCSYFSNKDYITKKITCTPKSIAVHDFANSWSGGYSFREKVYSRYIVLKYIFKQFFLRWT